MVDYLDKLAQDIVAQQTQLATPITGAPSRQAMQMANMPQGGIPPMMPAPRPQMGMPPPPPQQSPMATAMRRPEGAPRIAQTMRGGHEMDKSRRGYDNSFSGAMARRAQAERGMEIEERYAAEQKRLALEAMDQRYNDFKSVYSAMYPTLKADTLDSAARLVAMGQDPKDVLPQVIGKQEMFDVADKIYDDAKPMLESFDKTQVQFDTLNNLAARGWEGQGAGQVAALYTFIKELDPDSVVREGEVALAKSAQSIVNKFLAAYKNVTENTLMSEEMYNDIVGFTQDLNTIRRESYRDQFQYHGNVLIR